MRVLLNCNRNASLLHQVKFPTCEVSGCVEVRSLWLLGWTWKKRAAFLTKQGSLFTYKYLLQSKQGPQLYIGQEVRLGNCKVLEIERRRNAIYFKTVDENYKKLAFRVTGKEANLWDGMILSAFKNTQKQNELSPLHKAGKESCEPITVSSSDIENSTLKEGRSNAEKRAVRSLSEYDIRSVGSSRRRVRWESETWVESGICSNYTEGTSDISCSTTVIRQITISDTLRSNVMNKMRCCDDNKYGIVGGEGRRALGSGPSRPLSIGIEEQPRIVEVTEDSVTHL